MTAARGLIWPSVFWLGLFLVLVGLGTWQIERLHWKEGLIAQRQAQIHGPPSALPATLSAARGMEFHRVTLTGTFQNRGELYLHAIAGDGTAGYHVITPAVLADGRVVFVDRGFVPEARRDPASRPAGEFTGPVTVTGLVRLPQGPPSWFTPANEPDKNLWFSMDLTAMARADRLTDPLPYYVAADAAPIPGGFPVGGQTNARLPNDHLQYALTWYGLAGLCLVYYALFMRARVAERRKEAA